MKVNWRENTDPVPILKWVGDSATVGEDGKINYYSFNKMESDIILASLLEFSPEITASQKHFLVSRSISETVKSELTSQTFLKHINRLFIESQQNQLKVFHLLTSISISGKLIFRNIKIGRCEIRFYQKNYPKKFIKPKKNFDQVNKIEENSSFWKVVITTKGNSHFSAAEECLDALNCFRAFLNLELNQKMVFSFGESRPRSINKVSLGKFHTLHLENGNIAEQDLYWYDELPQAQKPIVFTKKEEKQLRTNSLRFLKNMQKRSFSEHIASSMVKFVSAMDQIDSNIAVIRGWSSLEFLAGTTKGNSEIVIRRCAFLTFDYDLNKTVLNHIRLYRNNNVHYGDASLEPKIICYQLQRYFKILCYFFIFYSDSFKNIQDIREYLDLPPKKDDLLKRAKLINKAIRLRSQT